MSIRTYENGFPFNGTKIIGRVTKTFVSGHVHSINDEPAVICNDHHEWYVNGIVHRDNGPATIYFDNGVVCGERWIQNGKLHREGGPAFWLNDGTEYWQLNGMLHRIDGPAFHAPGIYQSEWFIYGNDITKHIKIWARSMKIDLNNLSEDDKILILLRFGNGP